MNIFGKYIDDNQQVLKSLTKIYGIGRPTAKELCMTFGIGLDKKVKELSKDTWAIVIKAAELGPHKYKDLVKELQNSGQDDYGYLSPRAAHPKGENDQVSNPLVEAIDSFIFTNSENKKADVLGSVLINGKLRSQKVEIRALTDLR